jgi:hypothetical protein
MRSETPKVTLTKLFHDEKGLHNMRNLPKTPKYSGLVAPSVQQLW